MLTGSRSLEPRRHRHDWVLKPIESGGPARVRHL
jgi:hypothetical protein